MAAALPFTLAAHAQSGTPVRPTAEPHQSEAVAFAPLRDLVQFQGRVIAPVAVYAALGVKPFAEAPMLRSASRFGRRLH
ncbi:hypothetical protein IP84_09800 [beta proteobacterium AAP99]|nr:hypothetical protein IP84_09800 [beta proteobacterium AAP99]